MNRLRVRFAKTGKVRWTSHRDVARMWERAFRRTGLPLAYTEGFSPRPKVSFGLALPTGHESVAEYLDLDLAEAVDAGGLAERLSVALPTGIDVLVLAPLEDRAPSLQRDVTSCRWELEVVGASGDELKAAVGHALSAQSLPVTRERKGREVTDDIRPALLALAVEDQNRLACELATLERGVRPVELLRVLAPGAELATVRRTHQWIERDGARWEPLPLPATTAPHAEVRAS